MLDGIIGNQVKYLNDPVTVIGSLCADAIGSDTGSEKAHTDDDLKSGSLPVWD